MATRIQVKHCAQIKDIEARLECMDQVMFARVTNNALLGAAVGAVLGGAVAFAMSGGHPHSFIEIGIGLASGAMVGGVAGGLEGYLTVLRERANGNLEIMISDNLAQLRSDLRRLDLVEQTSQEVRDNLTKLDDKITAMLNDGEARNANELSSIQERLDEMNRSVSNLAQKVANFKQVTSVYYLAAKRLGIDSDPDLRDNLEKANQRIENIEIQLRGSDKKGKDSKKKLSDIL